MAVAARYLADKSALARAHLEPVAARLEPLYVGGEIATCGIVDLEVLFSTRSTRDYLAILADRRSLSRAEVRAEGVERAVEVQTALARKGQHRGVTIRDLLIAAAAEAAGLCVLHYDADFELIAGVTDQPVEWVVPPAASPEIDQLTTAARSTFLCATGGPDLPPPSTPGTLRSDSR